MSSDQNVTVYTYETRSAWQGWKVDHSSHDVREVEQLVRKARAAGLVEGRDFRTRVEITQAPC